MNSKQIKIKHSFVTRTGLAILCLMPFVAWAASDNPEQLNWLKMAMELFCGLALFLFGMDQMSEGLKAATGDPGRVKTRLFMRCRDAGVVRSPLRSIFFAERIGLFFRQTQAEIASMSLRVPRMFIIRFML